jgi:hypothetical protein
MKIEHKAPSGRIYQIETHTVACGRLVRVRISSGDWSHDLPLTWGMGNHIPAIMHATKIAERHAAGARIA